MVKYRVKIIYQIRCTCKSWIPKLHDGRGTFPEVVECPKCHAKWKPSQLVEPPISARMEEKIFDSESLLVSRIKYAMEKMHMDQIKANDYAVMIVAKQKKVFEDMYSIPIGVQQVFG